MNSYFDWCDRNAGTVGIGVLALSFVAFLLDGNVLLTLIGMGIGVFLILRGNKRWDD